MSKKEPYRILDGTVLKIIAMISMAFDHAGDLLFPEQVWMRWIGRLAMPIFAFFVAEGYIHTRDRKRYLLRMCAFALISELPFDLARTGKLEFTQQNTMFTFVLSILALMLFDRITGENPTVLKTVLGTAAVMAVAVISILLGADHTYFAVGLVFVYYVFRNKSHLIRNLAGLIFQVAVRNVGIYILSALSFIPLMMYNGKKGKGLKWMFYIFYPGHLLLLYLIRTALGM